MVWPFQDINAECNQIPLVHAEDYCTNNSMYVFHPAYSIVMFIMYLAADLTFVTLLTWEAVNDSGTAHNLSFTRPYNVAALLWILGNIIYSVCL